MQTLPLHYRLIRLGASCRHAPELSFQPSVIAAPMTLAVNPGAAG
jgi:hypothetical protein